MEAEIPQKLMCETCNERTIDVVVVWLETGDNSLSCMPCFLATSVAMLTKMTEEEDAAEPAPEAV